MKDSISTSHIARALIRRGEPESHTLLMSVYWWSAIVWFLCAFVAGVVVGLGMFFSSMDAFDLFTVNHSQVHPAFDENALHAMVVTIQTRGTDMEGVSAMDPMR